MLSTSTRLHLEGKVERLEQIIERCRYLRKRVREGSELTPHFMEELYQASLLIENTAPLELPPRASKEDARALRDLTRTLEREKKSLFKEVTRRLTPRDVDLPESLTDSLRAFTQTKDPVHFMKGGGWRSLRPTAITIVVMSFIGLGIAFGWTRGDLALYWWMAGALALGSLQRLLRSGRYWLTRDQLIWKPLFGPRVMADLKTLRLRDVQAKRGALVVGNVVVRNTRDEKKLAEVIMRTIRRRGLRAGIATPLASAPSESPSAADGFGAATGSDAQGLDEG